MNFFLDVVENIIGKDYVLFRVSLRYDDLDFIFCYCPNKKHKLFGCGVDVDRLGYFGGVKEENCLVKVVGTFMFV